MTEGREDRDDVWAFDPLAKEWLLLLDDSGKAE
jgi:hypothetical protein